MMNSLPIFACVLPPQALLLHMNWLTSLKGGGPLKDLAAMRASINPRMPRGLPDKCRLALEHQSTKYLKESC